MIAYSIEKDEKIIELWNIVSKPFAVGKAKIVNFMEIRPQIYYMKMEQIQE